MTSSEANAELETFRRQWQDEVLRRRGDVPIRNPTNIRPKHTRSSSKETSLISHLGASSSKNDNYEDDGNYGTYDFDDMEALEDSKRIGKSMVSPESVANREPISALDHYEMAVVRETEGKLGESLDLYRKAFRLDDAVDQLYKRKHFPPPRFKAESAEAKSSFQGAKSKEAPKKRSAVSALVSSFANVTILGVSPIIPGDISPPCPIKSLPRELLVEVIDHVAYMDIASLSRLAQASKYFAYLCTTEEGTWKSLVHGTRFGLGGMYYTWAREISNTSLEYRMKDLTIQQPFTLPHHLPITLPINTAYPTYRYMYQQRPRLRFSGVYISTVNYTRPGANGPNTLTWSTPIHVVTYYRYLRFYRDGSCISLLTTTEPHDVVPHLQKENIGSEFISTTTLPIGVMRDARRGRWKLGAPVELTDWTEHKHNSAKENDDLLATRNHDTQPNKASSPTPQPTIASISPPPARPAVHETDEREPEGMLTIETEGPTKAYQYTARFEIKSSSSTNNYAARNTKLVWRGFWSHNVISGDWAEFGLKNDRAFVWSRVRSWADA
ncbi:MAG: hypothetical protein GOMPHAMPRED_008295 [Gomphillus americanus]|uniref:F-box domain-containing protein n=1 Tax=Gomphillus americanus TaxID=1940652 RepID=A0A8H3EY77_9LECA|nr:MAG: hypothetical protein GOMPHAMPRED_008295 [Gomphillus americanus]